MIAVHTHGGCEAASRLPDPRRPHLGQVDPAREGRPEAAGLRPGSGVTGSTTCHLRVQEDRNGTWTTVYLAWQVGWIGLYASADRVALTAFLIVTAAGSTPAYRIGEQRRVPT